MIHHSLLVKDVLSSLMFTKVLLLFFVFCLTIQPEIASSTGVYVYDKDPYVDGPFIVDSFYLFKESGIPQHAVVYYPRTSGSYVVNFFVGGLFGIVPSEFYSEVLRRVATHGIVVIAIDTIIPFNEFPSSELKFKPDESLLLETIKDPPVTYQSFEWLRNNLNGILATKGDIRAEFDLVGLSCHSAGCANIVSMLKYNCSFTQGIVFLDPVALNLFYPVQFSIPAMVVGTELCPLPPHTCCPPGTSFNHFYNSWSCPRVLFNVTGFGHCDILDQPFYEACVLTKFCNTVNGTNLELYRTFSQGMVTAFFVASLQGNCKLVPYFLDESLIPLSGALTSDFHCQTDRCVDRGPLFCPSHLSRVKQ